MRQIFTENALFGGEKIYIDPDNLDRLARSKSITKGVNKKYLFQ
jgi:hypothetical protein